MGDYSLNLGGSKSINIVREGGFGACCLWPPDKCPMRRQHRENSS